MFSHRHPQTGTDTTAYSVDEETQSVKKETKEFARLLGTALIVMLAAPLVYRTYIYFWPPAEKPRLTLTQFFKEAENERCIRLLAKPIAKWTDVEAKSEPEIYAWLKEQGNEILPWDWTEESRRKNPKGYAKCWRRIWKERKCHCEKLLAQHHKELKHLNRELQILTAIHTHRTNQIARLKVIAATNVFPCQITLERLEKGRFWGWNKKVDMMECKDAAAIIAATNSICSKEFATAQGEIKTALALTDSISSLKEKSALYEKLREICNQNNRLSENESSQDEQLKKALIENLKRTKQ